MKTKILVKYLVPSILTNMSVFLFGIVDGIFVGNGIGTNALGAVNIVWPFVMINYGLNVLTAIGGVAISAVRFGRGDIKGANEAFLHSLVFTIFTSVIVTILGSVFTIPISRALGATNTYLPLVRDYLFYYSLFIIPASLTVNLQHYCRNDNDPQLVLYCTIISTALNIYLDYLFIFPLKLGIMGAALATGISQTVSFFITLIHYVGKRGNLRIKYIPLKASLFKKITLRGLPEMIAQFSSPVTIYCMNLVLAFLMGELGINTYAIICYVASFALSISYGVSEGLQPLFGRSYGAKNLKDLKFYFRIGLIITFIGSIICIVGVNSLSEQICYLFGTDDKTTASTVISMPQYSWAFAIVAVNALISAYLYSTKRSGSSILFNILRSFVINSICILLFPFIFGKSIIWFSNGIAEILIMIIGFIIIKYSERNGLIFK